MNVSIKGKDIALTESLKNFVEEKSDHLEQIVRNITELRVSLEVDDGHHRQGRIKGCVLVAHIPETKKELVAKDWEEDMHTAINKAFAQLERNIKNEQEKRAEKDSEDIRKLKENG